MAILKMAPNVPVKMTIKFVDVYANDTTKNSGKGYGSQVAVKGKVDGEDQTIYLKGFTNENLGMLQDAGVIAKQHYAHDPAEKYNIPVIDKHEVTLNLEQPAGQKYPKLKISNGNAPVSAPVDFEDYDSGYLPGDEQYEAPAKTNGKPVVADALTKNATREQVSQWKDMVTKYTESYNAASGIVGKEFGGDAIIAATATLFIQRMKAGV